MSTEVPSKPITKFVLLKVTYNSFYVESPDKWDWNNLIDCSHDENIEVFSVRDYPPKDEF